MKSFDIKHTYKIELTVREFIISINYSDPKHWYDNVEPIGINYETMIRYKIPESIIKKIKINEEYYINLPRPYVISSIDEELEYFISKHPKIKIKSIEFFTDEELVAKKAIVEFEIIDGVVGE